MECFELKDIIENEGFILVLRYILKIRLYFSITKIGNSYENCKTKLSTEVILHTYYRLCEKYKSRPSHLKFGEKADIDNRINEIIRKCKLYIENCRVRYNYYY